MVKARIEMGLGSLSILLAVLTMVWPTWIEGLFGVDPDGGTGETEWGIVAVFALAAVALFVVARLHYSHARRLASESV